MELSGPIWTPKSIRHLFGSIFGNTATAARRRPHPAAAASVLSVWPRQSAIAAAAGPDEPAAIEPPGYGNVETQPLPPPGGVVAPQPPQVGPQGAGVAPGQTPNALPPGPGSPRNAPQPVNTGPQPSDA